MIVDDLVNRIEGMKRGEGPSEGIPMSKKPEALSIMDIVGDERLSTSITALYAAESATEKNADFSKSAYLAAALGFEGYHTMVDAMSKIKLEGKGIDPKVFDQYNDLVRQMAQYCKDKCGYFGKSNKK